MTETEKNLYKSPLLQDEQQWKSLVPKLEPRLLNFPIPDKATDFFFTNLAQVDKKNIKEPSVVLTEHKFSAPAHRIIPDFERFEMTEDFLTDQLELERRRPKKEKKFDFI